MAFPKRKNLQEKKRDHLVILGSRNPVKIQGTEEAFQSAFEKSFMVQGLNVGSGVDKQSVGDVETLNGAYNRASNSRIAFPEADFWVGIEGGTDEINEDLVSYAWIVIMDKSGKVGKAKTAAFFLPKAVHNLVKEGTELGAADESVFNEGITTQGKETVEILTNGTFSRKDLYKQAVILGLIPFLNPDRYG